MKTAPVKIGHIDTSIQTRAQLDEMAVREYMEAKKSGAAFPPVDVFSDGESDVYLLVDGLHRTEADKRCGKSTVNCRIHQGTKEDAIKFALGTNDSHGIRRTNADKRQIVMLALAHLSNLSDNLIANLCKVSHTFVGSLRPKPELATPASSTPPPRKGADGKSRSMPPKRKPKQDSAVTLDETGLEVPRETLELWNRWPEAKGLVTYAEALKMQIKAIKDNDPLFRFLSISMTLAKLEQVIADLELAIPHAVCPTCQGKLPKGCLQCKGGGYVNKFHWRTCVPEDIRNLRPKP